MMPNDKNIIDWSIRRTNWEKWIICKRLEKVTISAILPITAATHSYGKNILYIPHLVNEKLLPNATSQNLSPCVVHESLRPLLLLRQIDIRVVHKNESYQN